MSVEKVEKAPAVQRTEHTLKKAHRHRGVDLLPGATIKVRPDQEKRLKEKGVI